jgi:hypothetical protein
MRRGDHKPFMQKPPCTSTAGTFQLGIIKIPCTLKETVQNRELICRRVPDVEVISPASHDIADAALIHTGRLIPPTGIISSHGDG